MIRNANKNDIPEIRKLMKSEPDFWDNSWRQNVIDIAIESSRDLAFVWVENDKILGFVCAHDIGFRAYLSELIVSSECRKSGIGKALVQGIQKALTQKGCKVLIADVWKDSVEFYRSLGFSEPDVRLLRKTL
jgi:ribosomal protein S18 acetylase RimI-like enzyme